MAVYRSFGSSESGPSQSHSGTFTISVVPPNLPRCVRLEKTPNGLQISVSEFHTVTARSNFTQRMQTVSEIAVLAYWDFCITKLLLPHEACAQGLPTHPGQLVIRKQPPSRSNPPASLHPPPQHTKGYGARGQSPPYPPSKRRQWRWTDAPSLHLAKHLLTFTCFMALRFFSQRTIRTWNVKPYNYNSFHQISSKLYDVEILLPQFFIQLQPNCMKCIAIRVEWRLVPFLAICHMLNIRHFEIFVNTGPHGAGTFV